RGRWGGLPGRSPLTDRFPWRSLLFGVLGVQYSTSRSRKEGVTGLSGGGSIVCMAPCKKMWKFDGNPFTFFGLWGIIAITTKRLVFSLPAWGGKTAHRSSASHQSKKEGTAYDDLYQGTICPSRHAGLSRPQHRGLHSPERHCPAAGD